MPLLEREDALAALGEHAGSAADGHGRVVLVSGEAGVGKSTLVEHFEAAAPRARWVHGACDGSFTPRSLGPLFDVAEELGGDLLAACRAGAPREELFRLLLVAISDGDRPTAVVVEDVHWADESTLDLLRFLGRRVRNAPVLLICTYRDDELRPDHPLRLVIGELASTSSTRRVRLAPLSAAAVRVLAAGSTIDAGELHRLSGGNPFFVTEVLRAGSAELPESARDAVLARLARTSPSAQRTAEVAAMIGAHVDAWLFDAVAAPAADLDELLACGLLVSDGEGLRFRHEIARLAVEQQVPAHRRKQMHREVLAALEAHGAGDEARLAYHADGAEDAAAVLRFAPVAAVRASALGSHREAAAQYERAIRFTDARDLAALAALYDLLAAEHARTDTWERAMVAGEQALRLWRQVGDTRRTGASMSKLSSTMWRLCRPEARRYAEDALATLEPLGPSAELAWAYANVEFMDTRGDRSVAVTRRARTLAEELGLPDVVSDALTNEAWELSGAGGDWFPVIRRSLDVALAAGAEADLQAGCAYANLWELFLLNDRFAECETALEEGLAYCERRDIITFAYCTRAGTAWLRLAQGRWDEAVEAARPLWTVPVSSPVNRTMLALALGPVLARRGDPAAWRYLDEAAANALRSDAADWYAQVYPARVEAHWLAGDLEAARRELAVVVERLEQTSALWVWPVLAWCARLGLDHPAVTGRPDDPTALLLAGDFVGATRAWDRLGKPYEAALACYDSGTEAGLREALRRFEALGADAAAEAARRQMRRIGVRSVPSGARAATRAHPLGLTRREAEVLELIRAGRTNAEISAELFLSVRTVDHHVAAVLAKLGVHSRAAAASKAAGTGATLLRAQG